MKRHRPLVDGWVCPRCGQVGTRHGRGGARGCHSAMPGPVCPGLVCRCGDGVCFAKHKGYGWRRSPCRNAQCMHCGWVGEVRSREFEKLFGNSRCPKSATGWHTVEIVAEQNQTPDVLRLQFKCIDCHATGSTVIDPVQDVRWNFDGDDEEDER